MVTAMIPASRTVRKVYSQAWKILAVIVVKTTTTRERMKSAVTRATAGQRGRHRWVMKMFLWLSFVDKDSQEEAELAGPRLSESCNHNVFSMFHQETQSFVPQLHLRDTFRL